MNIATKNADFEIIKYDTDAEWAEMRNTGIGGSEIATILGINPYCSPYKLWQIKTGQISGNAENHYTMVGHYIEDTIAKMWEHETGKKVIESTAGNWHFRNPEEPWMLYSPDRLFWMGDGRNARDWKSKGILELKSTQSNPENDPLKLKRWYCQNQWGMGISHIEYSEIAWLIGTGFQFGKREWSFDLNFFKTVKEIAHEFHFKNCKEGIAPEITTADDVMALFPRENEGEVVNASAELYEKFTAYKTIDAEMKKLEEQRDALKNDLIVGMGSAEMLMYDGQKLCTYKAPKETMKFDSTAFKAANPELYGQYCKPQQGARRFVVK